MTERMEIPDVWGHISQRWPSSEPFSQAAKVAEEAGEVVGAAIKEREGRRTVDDVLDELADTIIAAMGAIQARGCNVSRVVTNRWAEVVER
ncbi:pyrophosphohydrolase domain-containing protein [Tsukamurella ocularis]|uniref:hypothetical protein n=1 Tax=Tsukamurella ocularis TaxID=1970234 RepID=UPI0039EF669F